jgi:hypothetical protein
MGIFAPALTLRPNQRISLGLARYFGALLRVTAFRAESRGVRPAHRRGVPKIRFEMDWEKIRSWWPYALLGLTAVGLFYRWLYS